MVGLKRGIPFKLARQVIHRLLCAFARRVPTSEAKLMQPHKLTPMAFLLVLAVFTSGCMVQREYAPKGIMAGNLNCSSKGFRFGRPFQPGTLVRIWNSNQPMALSSDLQGQLSR